MNLKDTTKQNAIQGEWIDKQDILQRMNISERTLYNWRRSKALPFARIYGKIYYRESDLQALLDKNVQYGTAR